jgi:hypothetical protein
LDHADILRLANEASRGRRPYFFENPDVDRLLSIVWAMAAELAVTRERLDTVERLLARRELLDLAAIDNFRPTSDEARERGQWHLEYIARLLRVLQQEVETMQRSRDASSEDLAGELSR